MKQLQKFIILALACFAVALTSSAAELKLSWKDNSTNEAGFAIERQPEGGAFAEVARTGADVATWTDTGLPNSTKFTYRVRAFNESGYSEFCDPVSATTAIPLPDGAPSDLQVVTVSVVVTVATKAATPPKS